MGINDTSGISGEPQGHDNVLTAGGLSDGCGDDYPHSGESAKLAEVKFVDDHKNPRGRGRLDLSTGERF